VRDQPHAPAALYLRERPGTHWTGGWVGPRAGLDRCEISRPPPGFDPRTVQPVASRYTDWATGPTLSLYSHKSTTNKLFNDSSDNKTDFVYGDEFFVCTDSDDLQRRLDSVSGNTSSGFVKIETTMLNRLDTPRVICAEFNVQYCESCDRVAFESIKQCHKHGATHLQRLLSGWPYYRPYPPLKHNKYRVLVTLGSLSNLSSRH
jgi:hypothetical protein